MFFGLNQIQKHCSYEASERERKQNGGTSRRLYMQSCETKTRFLRNSSFYFIFFFIYIFHNGHILSLFFFFPTENWFKFDSEFCILYDSRNMRIWNFDMFFSSCQIPSNLMIPDLWDFAGQTFFWDS